MKKILKNYILFSLIVIFAIAAFGTMIYSGARLIFQGGVGDFFSGKKQPAVCKEFRRLDGVCLADGETEKFPVGIMIDNKTEARPWSGLSYAGLVFEAPVEGGVTRFLAIYTTDKKIEKIGPVRSIRPYYVDWDKEFGAIMMHIGGSPEALDRIASDQSLYEKNIDGLGAYFWRSQDRIAPHNAYTSSELIDKARENLKIGESDFNFWEFKEDEIASERGATSTITVKFNNYDFYNAVWEYDREKNEYRRKYKNTHAKDEDGRMILAKNVAILKTDIEIIDSVSRRRIAAIGNGDALIFQDGKRIEARWEKRSESERLYFFDQKGADIKFNRGTTWIEVVEDLGQVGEK